MTDTFALATTATEPDLGSLRGVTMPASAGDSGGFLSDVIVQLGFADAGAVERAVQESSRIGGTAEQLLLQRGEIDEEHLARAVAERNGLPFVNLREFEVDEAAMHLIDRSMALRYRAIPIAFAPDGSLLVALADPLNALAVSDLSVVTKSQVIAAVAVAAQIDALIEVLPASAPSEVADWSAGLDVRSSRTLAVESSWAPQLAGQAREAGAHHEAEPAFEPMPSSASADGHEAAAPALALAPERSSSVSPAEREPIAERLRGRIAELVEELVADASQGDASQLEAETERLRCELQAERAKRDALEREREDGEASRQSMARALQETSADLERATLEADRLRTELAHARADAERSRAAAPQPSQAPQAPQATDVSVPPPGTR